LPKRKKSGCYTEEKYLNKIELSDLARLIFKKQKQQKNPFSLAYISCTRGFIVTFPYMVTMCLGQVHPCYHCPSSPSSLLTIFLLPLPPYLKRFPQV
jgi:hypothetical protein